MMERQPLSPYRDHTPQLTTTKKLYGTRRIVYPKYPQASWVNSATNTRKNLLTAGSVRHNSNRTVAVLTSSLRNATTRHYLTYRHARHAKSTQPTPRNTLPTATESITFTSDKMMP